MDPNT